MARHKLLDGLLAVVLCIVAAGVVREAVTLISADLTSSIARHDLSKWASGEIPYSEVQWERTHTDLVAAVALTPDDATLHDALAQLYSVKGRSIWTTGRKDSPELIVYGEALTHQEASIKLRPTHAMAWANLALFRYAVDSNLESLFQAWREAARLGPKEIDVENTLVTIAADTWAQAPDDVKQWTESRRPGIGDKLAHPPPVAASEPQVAR